MYRRRPALLLLIVVAIILNAVPLTSQAQAYPLIVYNDTNYGGYWCYSTQEERADIYTGCNDQISSIQLQPGWSVRLYRDLGGVTGPSFCLSSSTSDLSGNTFEDGSPANDAISSFALIQGAWCGGTPTPAYPLEVFTEPSYVGTKCWSTGSETANVYGACDNQISSTLLRSGWSLKVFRDPNQAGPYACLTDSDPDLSDNRFNDGGAMNDAISSFVLYNQPQCANQAPRPPILATPVNGMTLNSRAVKLTWQDAGDPDNLPWLHRNFSGEIWKTDNSWRQSLAWQNPASWSVTLPSDGAYTWRIQSGDGWAASSWSTSWFFTVTTAPPPTYPLEVFVEPNYSGTRCWSTAAERANVAGTCNDQISSIRLQPGWTARVYRDTTQGGPNICLTESDANLGDNRFNDGSPMDNAISSFILTQQASCANQPPNPPTLTGPASGASLPSHTVTLTWQDAGDTDAMPWLHRNFSAEIWKADNSWHQSLDWQVVTSWSVSVPSDGAYTWRVRAGDGWASSAWAERSFTVVVASDRIVLPVRYVDQVFAQQPPLWIGCDINGTYNPWCYNLWNYCGPASAAMVLHYYGLEQRDVLYDQDPTAELASVIRLPSGATEISLLRAELERRGLLVSTRWDKPSFAEVRQGIQSGNPVILSLSPSPDHILVAVGVSGSNTIIVNDPFGGLRWWDDQSQINTYIDGVYHAQVDSPQLKGAGVEYDYDALPGHYYTMFLERAPALQAATATIASTGGTVSAGNIRLDFPGTTAAFVQAAAATKVTLTPQFTPTHQTQRLSVGAFTIAATDAQGLPLARHSTSFTITVQLDKDLVDGTVKANGQTSSRSGQGVGQEHAQRRVLTMARWDDAQKRWVAVPAQIDRTNSRVVVQSDSFTEFTVFMELRSMVYLPLVRR